MWDFFTKWWDAGAFVILAALHIYALVEQRLARGDQAGQAAQAGQDEERRSGAQIITASSAAGITAVAILVPASMLIVQLSSTSASLPLEVVLQVFRAALWFLVSLFFGLFVVSVVPFRSPAQDVRKSMQIGIPFGLQLFSLFVGMARLILGLYQFMVAKGG
jgi:hypothetical protein